MIPSFSSSRDSTISDFKAGNCRLLIATSVAARGLDIPDIQYIVHYHLPLKAEAYTHRNGRTARMHAKGSAYVILHEEENIPEYITGDPKHFI